MSSEGCCHRWTRIQVVFYRASLSHLTFLLPWNLSVALQLLQCPPVEHFLAFLLNHLSDEMLSLMVGTSARHLSEIDG